MKVLGILLIFLSPSFALAQSNCTLSQEFRIYQEDSSQSEVLFTNNVDGASAQCLQTSEDGQMTMVSVNGITGWVFSLGVSKDNQAEFSFDSEPESDSGSDSEGGLWSQSDNQSATDKHDELATVTPRFKPMMVTPRFKPQLSQIPDQDQDVLPRDLVYDRCFTKHLLKSTKRNVRRNHNHFGSRGYCGRAVAQSIKRAGIRIQKGNGIDYYRPSGSGRPSGYLERAGFTNFYEAVANKIRAKGKKVNQRRLIAEAPAGAVLVFKGPDTDRYWRNGRIGEPPGDYVGHVTIKGNDGLFYTDGKTRRAAIKNRQLVGIYLMKDCSHCSKKVKQRSEAACGK